MKTLLILLFIFFSFLLFSNKTFAHSRGVPIFKINDVLTKVYPIESSSIEPYLGDTGDIASENYLVNQKLTFDFEASNSANIQPDLLERITYIWDFGDGTKELKTNTPQATHTYKKIGSFILYISADYSKTGNADIQPQIVQSTLMHILPNKGYKLPEPIVKVNEKPVSPRSLTLGNEPLAVSGNPLSDFALLRAKSKTALPLDFNNTLYFDASDSKSQSSRIIQYQWDLGQGNITENKSDSVRYNLPQYYSTAVVRIRDKNGFIAEAAIDLQNSGSNEPRKFSIWDYISPLAVIILVQVVLFGVGIAWYIMRKKKKDTS